MLLWALRCIYLFELVFLSFYGYISRMELLDHMVVLFLVFWETLLFAIVATLITFPATVYRFPYSPHSHQCLLSVVLLMIAILTGMKWYLVVLIPLMGSGVEHLFICLLAICIPSLEKCVSLRNILKLSCLLFWCGVVWAVYIFWILTHFWMFSPFH